MEQILLIIILGLVAFIAWQVAGRPKIAKWLITGIAGLAFLVVMWGIVSYPITIEELQRVSVQEVELEDRQPFEP